MLHPKGEMVVQSFAVDSSIRPSHEVRQQTTEDAGKTPLDSLTSYSCFPSAKTVP